MERSSLRIIHSDFSRLSRSAANNPHSVARRGRRTYKACERCRDQKLRCDVRDTSSDLRCHRCTVHGFECTLDFATPSGRRPRRTCNDGRRRQRRDASTVCEETNTEPIESARSPAARPIPARSQHFEGDQHIRSSIAQNETGHSPVSPDFTTGLTSQDLRAPVSAVHQMSTPEERVSDAAGLVPGSHWSVPAAGNLRATGESFGFLGRMDTPQDVVSSGLIQESQARSLFTLFMACAGNYMPIFDPVLDSFDGLRRREPFCFVVILSLACCVEQIAGLPDSCKLTIQEEAKRLTAQSLFTKPITLGSVQAMLLLAAYAEEASFAIGHALQMARDLQIDYALSKLVSGDNASSLPLKEKRRLMREVRVWLALCYVEREIAAGTATHSRLEVVDTGLLERLRSHPLYGPTELRVTSLVEIVQLREKLQQEIARPVGHQSANLDQLICIEAKYCKWLEFWDNLHDEYGFEECSFQRASLRGQKNWALMFTGCAILGRLQKEEGVGSLQLSAGPVQGPAEGLIKYIVAAVTDQLHFIVRTTAYRWHLRWATNYTALSVTFAIVFALSIARTHENLIDREEILSLADEIARILQPYPHPHFHRLIRLLINLTGNRPAPSDLEVQEFRRAQPNEPAGGIAQLPEEHDPIAATEHIPPGLSIEALLSEHLQDADWMLDPSSITSASFPVDSNMALLDQDLSAMHDFTLPV